MGMVFKNLRADTFLSATFSTPFIYLVYFSTPHRTQQLMHQASRMPGIGWALECLQLLTHCFFLFFVFLLFCFFYLLLENVYFSLHVKIQAEFWKGTRIQGSLLELLSLIVHLKLFIYHVLSDKPQTWCAQ